MSDAPPGFRLLDRTAWAHLGRGREPAGASPPPGSPVTGSEWREVYVPLAHIVGVHVEARVSLARRLAAAGLRDIGSGPFIIGLAGSVAGGKSTAAGALAALLRARSDRPSVEVVSTDGFLFRNDVLMAQGLLPRKGYPDSYDPELMTDVLGALAAGASPVSVPRYSHEVYDVAGPAQVLDGPDIVIVEGVNALQSPIAEFCALRLYLDASEPDLRAWYVDRFLALIEAARQDHTSFFAQWTGLSPADASSLAVTVWEHVNLPNLTDHILPTRWRADLVLTKDSSHAVREIAVRSR